MESIKNKELQREVADLRLQAHRSQQFPLAQLGNSIAKVANYGGEVRETSTQAKSVMGNSWVESLPVRIHRAEIPSTYTAMESVATAFKNLEELQQKDQVSLKLELSGQDTIVPATITYDASASAEQKPLNLADLEPVQTSAEAWRAQSLREILVESRYPISPATTKHDEQETGSDVREKIGEQNEKHLEAVPVPTEQETPVAQNVDPVVSKLDQLEADPELQKYLTKAMEQRAVSVELEPEYVEEEVPEEIEFDRETVSASSEDNQQW